MSGNSTLDPDNFPSAPDRTLGRRHRSRQQPRKPRAEGPRAADDKDMRPRHARRLSETLAD